MLFSEVSTLSPPTLISRGVFFICSWLPKGSMVPYRIFLSYCVFFPKKHFGISSSHWNKGSQMIANGTEKHPTFYFGLSVCKNVVNWCFWDNTYFLGFLIKGNNSYSITSSRNLCVLSLWPSENLKLKTPQMGGGLGFG